MEKKSVSCISAPGLMQYIQPCVAGIHGAYGRFWKGRKRILQVLVLCIVSSSSACGESETGSAAALFDHPDSQRVFSHIESTSTKAREFGSFCRREVETQSGRIFAIRKGEKYIRLDYSTVEKDSLPHALGFTDGTELHRTEKTSAIWDQFHGRGLPGLCWERSFELLALRDSIPYAVWIRTSHSLDSLTLSGPKGEQPVVINATFYRLRAPRGQDYGELMELNYNATIPKSEYEAECSTDWPKRMAVVPIPFGEEIGGLQISNVASDSVFHDMGFRSGDIFRAVKPRDPAAGFDEYEFARPVCDKGDSELLIERSGEIYDVLIQRETARLRPATDREDDGAAQEAIRIQVTMTPRSEDSLAILAPVHKDNPLNPASGLPFTDRQMEQFATLREKFPGNETIPTRLNTEQSKEKEERLEKVYGIRSKMATKEATCQEVAFYFDHSKKQLRDRIELIQYVFKSSATMSPEMHQKFKKVLQDNRQSLQELDQKESQELSECKPAS